MTDDTIAFRDADAGDVPALVALVTSAYRGESSRAGWTTEADLLDGNRIDSDVVRGDIEREHSRVLLASRDGVLLGCAHVAIENGAGYFGMFAVDPLLQAGGIGKAILAEAERVVRDEWQLPMMRMTVIDLREDLIAWYERRGYRRTGIKKPFPAVDPRFGLPRRDDLRFEVLEKGLQHG